MAFLTGFAQTGTNALMNELARRQQAQKEEQERQRQYEQVRAMFQGMGLNVPNGNLSMDAAVPVANYQLQQRNQQTERDNETARMQTRLDYLRTNHPAMASVIDSVKPEMADSWLLDQIIQDVRQKGETTALLGYGNELNKRRTEQGLQPMDFSQVDNPQVIASMINQGFDEVKYSQTRKDTLADTASDRQFQLSRDANNRNAQWDMMVGEWNLKNPQAKDRQYFGVDGEAIIDFAKQQYQRGGLPALEKAMEAGGKIERMLAGLGDNQLALDVGRHLNSMEMQLTLAEGRPKQNISNERGGFDEAPGTRGTPPTQQVMDFMNNTGRNERLFGGGGDVIAPAGQAQPTMGDVAREAYPGVAGKVLGFAGDVLGGMQPGMANTAPLFGPKAAPNIPGMSTKSPIFNRMLGANNVGAPQTNTPVFNRMLPGYTPPMETKAPIFQRMLPTNNVGAPEIKAPIFNRLLPRASQQGVPSNGFNFSFVPGQESMSPEMVDFLNRLELMRRMANNPVNQWLPAGL